MSDTIADRGTQVERDDWIDRHDPVGLLQCAIRCDTVNPPGNEEKLALILADVLRKAGIDYDLRLPEDGRANLTATTRGSAPGPRLVLSGHLDTVPIGDDNWRFDPFSGEIEGDRIYGRGTTDMKGGLLALLIAFLRTHETGPADWAGELVFAASYSEETGSQGAQAMIEDDHLGRFDAMIVAEPTANHPVVAHKGVLWVDATAHGQTGHSSTPENGVNAIDAMRRFLSLAEGLDISHEGSRLLAPPSMTVTQFRAGKGRNVIPDRCDATLDVRTLPGQGHGPIISALQDCAMRVEDELPGSGLSLKASLDLPGVETARKAPIVTAATRALNAAGIDDTKPRGVQYFTDGSVFARLGGDILILGAGRPDQAHRTDEFLEITEYLKSVDIYRAIIQDYCQLG